jgi:hypothetical protein
MCSSVCIVLVREGAHKAFNGFWCKFDIKMPLKDVKAAVISYCGHWNNHSRNPHHEARI